MASYLSSYFGGGSSNNQVPQYGQYQPHYQQYQQTQQQPQSGSTWSGTFSSRIGAIKKALTRDNEEDDPDNEDSSHVSNVLRAYYTEKGRPFPEWLPPDPKKPPVATVVQPQYSQYGSLGGQYGTNTAAPHSRGYSGGRGGGLSDLWDANPGLGQSQAQSLRAPRPSPQALRSFDSSSSHQSGQDSYSAQVRPLPSQRAGSYQNLQVAPAQSSGGNPRDRLRARLQGSGSGRSSPGNVSHVSHTSNGSPSVSVSQPWTNDGSSRGSSGGHDVASGHGSPSYQQRSSKYR